MFCSVHHPQNLILVTQQSWDKLSHESTSSEMPFNIDMPTGLDKTVLGDGFPTDTTSFCRLCEGDTAGSLPQPELRPRICVRTDLSAGLIIVGTLRLCMRNLPWNANDGWCQLHLPSVLSRCWQAAPSKTLWNKPHVDPGLFSEIFRESKSCKR